LEKGIALLMQLMREGGGRPAVVVAIPVVRWGGILSYRWVILLLSREVREVSGGVLKR